MVRYIMETNNTNLAITAINAIRALIAYRTELDNEFLCHPNRYDEDFKNSFLERYYAVTALANNINYHFNPLEKQCVTLQ